MNTITTYRSWIAEKTKLPNDKKIAQAFKEKYNVESKAMEAITWLGIFEDTQIPTEGIKTSADILQSIIEDKWRLLPSDKDMIIMQHQIEYERKQQIFKLKSTMVVKGDNDVQSAMAKTVGLPMAILAIKILQGKINTQRLNGVHIPIMPEVYNPVLKELEKHGISFTDIYV